MVSSDLLENLVLGFYSLKIFFAAVFGELDNFQGIDIFSFLSTGHIYFSVGSLTQSFKYFEV